MANVKEKNRDWYPVFRYSASELIKENVVDQQFGTYERWSC